MCVWKYVKVTTGICKEQLTVSTYTVWNLETFLNLQYLQQVPLIYIEKDYSLISYICTVM